MRPELCPVPVVAQLWLILLLSRLREFCCGLAMNWRGVARGALVIETNTVFRQALAKLREAPSLLGASVKGDANFLPGRRLRDMLSRPSANLACFPYPETSLQCRDRE